jgi:geranylgeranyl pyrophosphate synthase
MLTQRHQCSAGSAAPVRFMRPGHAANLAQTLIDSELNLAAVRSLITDLIAPQPLASLSARPTAATAAAVHLNGPGQQMRAKLALHAARMFAMTDADAVALAASAELLHNASLVHDDIQDRTPARRGQDAIWCTFGIDIALCAGDLMLSGAYAALAGVSDASKIAALLRLVHDRTGTAIRGQCADLSASEPATMSITEYSAIAAAKSGALLSLPLELVFVVAGDQAAAADGRRAAEQFAIGYQIADDIADLTTDLAADRPALNILQVLGGGPSALSQARALGLAHLRCAAVMAEGLPRGSGALLHGLVLQLSAKLAIAVA